MGCKEEQVSEHLHMYCQKQRDKTAPVSDCFCLACQPMRLVDRHEARIAELEQHPAVTDEQIDRALTAFYKRREDFTRSWPELQAMRAAIDAALQEREHE